MNTKFKYIFSTAALLLSVGFTSCTGDLDVKPIDPNLNTKENTSPESAFNKCYAHIAMACLLYTSPSPRDYAASRMPSSA